MIQTQLKQTDLKMLNTKFGQIAYSVDDVIHFAMGIYGFEQYHQYILADQEKFQPFRWLICVDDPELMFTVIDPYIIVPDYDTQLVGDDEERLILTIVTIKSREKIITTNLRAPIVIDEGARQGEQVILMDPQYALRHQING